MSWLGARARPTRHIITAHQQTAEAGISLNWLDSPSSSQPAISSPLTCKPQKRESA
ncbi:hypothetical protein ACK377_04260 [Aeromonas veronii]|uniref:hypothetical protein n=1 Tax=Aeromonas veronii TaxID=654 RepID=UPI0038EDC757